ncbi:hypothetical protein NE237_019434 [Protea cynaroides]|uniref:NB-ARC domain-containing protein n=1 Tax=Protea cynaroides TaxID=273540 RepID=A0A9Q0QPV5_9MAGN|nr:hypothetical protein NE237_019434 [Protea cynaroides]
MGHTLLAEVDSLHEVEDKLWSLLCLLMRLRSFLMEVERKQSEELKKFVMEVVTLVHEAEKVTVSYLDITRKSGLVMDETHKFKSKIMGFRSKMMESHAWFHKFSESNTSNTSSLSKQRPPPSTEDGDTVVVLEDEVKRMINLLTDEDQDGQCGIIPIVGPGGMGKTFFVRTIYNDSTIVEHFPCRLWINVSSNHKIEELLQDIIEQVKPATTATTATSDNTEDGDRRKEMKNLKDLAIETYKLLKNSTRYLVVFDNVCKAQFWANINPVFLANNKHGSRIIVITRHVEVVSHLRSSRPSFYLRRLSKEEGRTLFSKRVNSLVDSHSHTQLDPNHYHTYHELVDACGGLPLAIIALATEYHRRLLSATNNEKNEESGIDNRKGLVKLQPPRVKIQSRDQASSSAASTAVVAAEIEDTAEEYLNELINMNLIKVQRRTSDGRIKEITIPREYYSLSDLCRSKTFKFVDRLARVFPLLERLQKLHMENTQIFQVGEWWEHYSSKLEIFPPNITHLTLIRTRIEAEYLERALLKLQNLRILKLDKQSIHFSDNVLGFRIDVHGFRQLKFLKLKGIGISNLNISVGAMPSLQKLTVISCKSLEGLPSEALEAIPTLQELELQVPLKDTVLSDARLIKEHVGKDRLKLSIYEDGRRPINLLTSTLVVSMDKIFKSFI